MLKIKPILIVIAAVIVCGCATESLGLHYSEDLNPLYGREGSFFVPGGVAIHEDRVFIMDRFHILVTDLYGNYVKTIEIPNYSTGIAISGNRMFVSDEADGVVRILDLDGIQVGAIGDEHPEGVTYMDRFGVKGRNLGHYHFASPTKLAVNNGSLFVVEGYFGKIKIFDLDGVYVDEFHTFNKRSDWTPAYGDPLDVAVNSTHVFIADHWLGEVHIVNATGTGPTREPVGVIAMPGVAAVAVNDNNIFVSATGDMIKIFNMDGTYVTALRGCDADDWQLEKPLEITYIDTLKLLNKTLDPSGFITVAPMGIAVQDNHLVLVNWHEDVPTVFDPECIHRLGGFVTPYQTDVHKGDTAVLLAGIVIMLTVLTVGVLVYKSRKS